MTIPTNPNLSREWIIAQRPPRAATPDPLKPHGFFLEDELAASGRVVSCGTILLTNKECPWRCLMCDLWKNTLTQTVPLGAIPRQIEFALAQFEGRASRACGMRAADCLAKLGAQGTDAPYLPPEHIKLYNSGSFFDPAAIPFADYPDIARNISFAKHVVVESHPRLIGEKALRLRDLLSGSLELAMGLETIHPQVLPRLNKKFDLDDFSRAAEFLRREGISMRAFVLVKPPFLNDAEGIEWAVKSAAFAFDCGATVVSLIPTRGGNGAMEQLRSTGDFNPPRVTTLEHAHEHSLKLKVGRVFVDTWDLETFSNCAVCFEIRRQRLHAMNLSQDILPAIYCQNCGGI